MSSLPEEDCVPPARVRDLEITVTGGNRSILATWTSPGGDLDQGSVDRFTVVYSVDVSDLLDEAAEAKVLATLDRQAVAGDSLVQEIEFPFSNQLWHIGLYACDGEGNRGRMSNIQQVFIPEPVTSAPVQVHRLGQILSYILSTNSQMNRIMFPFGDINGKMFCQKCCSGTEDLFYCYKWFVDFCIVYLGYGPQIPTK